MTQHQHDNHHETESILSFDEKMIKLLEHWIKHNDDHSKTYRDWEKKSKDNDMAQIGSLLEDAIDMTAMITKKFEEALKLIVS
jgi:hypothetical protein